MNKKILFTVNYNRLTLNFIKIFFFIALLGVNGCEARKDAGQGHLSLKIKHTK